MSNRRILDIC